ncbi:MAG: sigma 54-interacting transcriptional regulator [Spirochaetales bacterium]|nr:sigma 54-interacting transcriptional regulator [Spirochaetales bacterium]
MERTNIPLQAVLNSISDVILVVDEEGRYREILTSCRDLLLMEPEQLRGKLMQEVIPGKDTRAFLAAVRRTIATGRPELLEYELQVPAGRRWFEGRTTPLDLEIEGRKCVVFAIRDVTDRKRVQQLQDQNVYLLEEIRGFSNPSGLIGRSRVMQEVYRAIQLVADTDSTVLLLGETGTGKELVARAIHDFSRRRRGVLVTVNCSALPPGLVESELFGHEKGAFTGADSQHKGKFELACGGTLLLDEVGELPPEIQVKLLRVLQEQEIQRVGGTRSLKTDVRVIAATNRDLKQAVSRGEFRADLYFRLNIFPIQLPALRQRREDIPDLARHFVAEFARRMGKQTPALSDDFIRRLGRYSWPGNVRELANVLERAVILCRGDTLAGDEAGILEDGGLQISMTGQSPAELPTLEENERAHILRALDRTGGVVGGPRGAARLLGLKRSTLWSRMQKLGINGAGGS